jgi:hypothetical protein
VSTARRDEPGERRSARGARQAPQERIYAGKAFTRLRHSGGAPIASVAKRSSTVALPRKRSVAIAVARARAGGAIAFEGMRLCPSRAQVRGTGLSDWALLVCRTDPAASALRRADAVSPTQQCSQPATMDRIVILDAGMRRSARARSPRVASPPHDRLDERQPYQLRLAASSWYEGTSSPHRASVSPRSLPAR